MLSINVFNRNIFFVQMWKEASSYQLKDKEQNSEIESDDKSFSVVKEEKRRKEERGE